MAAVAVLAVFAGGTFVASHSKDAPDAGSLQTGKQDKARTPRALQPLLSENFVTLRTDGTIVVDFAGDPAAAQAALEAADAARALEGRTVQIVGIKALSPAERRAQDAALSANDPAVKPQLCPALPSGPRNTDGMTRPHLGCDISTGAERLGAPVGGPVAESLGKAVAAVFEQAGVALAESPVVTVADGAATIDVNLQSVTTSRLEIADVRLLQRDLNFTVHSNGLVRSVSFVTKGDCLAYATAMGSDSCLQEEFSK